MTLANDLARAELRIADLEAKLAVLSGQHEGSAFRLEGFDWATGNSDDGTLNLPNDGAVVIDLGKSRHKLPMRLTVRVADGPDGTLGIEVSGEHRLRFTAHGSNTIYVTEQDPRDVPKGGQ